ncbi:MAG TPA: ATP-binding protein [Herpetosiphonaceae bacterium]
MLRRRIADSWRPQEPIVLLTLIFAVILVGVGTLGLFNLDPSGTPPTIIIVVDFIVGALLFWLGRWMIRNPFAKAPRVIVVTLIAIGSFVGLSVSTVPTARSAGLILPILFAVVATGRILPILFYPVIVGLILLLNLPMKEQFSGFEFGFALLLFLVMWSIREHAAWQGAQRAEAAAKLQQEQVLTTFMRFIAHELRGAASVLSVLAPTLHARLTAPPDQWASIDGAAAYTAYADTTKRINDLLQRLLIITRAGVLSSEQIRRVALAPLLKEAINELMALDLPIEIKLDVPPDLEVQADPAYLWMACTTALRNAAEAMQVTGRPTVTIRASQTEQQCTIRVEDSGPGFSPRLLAQLQAMGTTSALPIGTFTTKIGGTGLGLPLMDRVARLHNGTFSCGNLAGGGAWVQIMLPNPERAQA